MPVAGRTHGMHAEPTTFGAKFALWALQADRDRQRLRRARGRVAVGKLSGAVGTYSNIDPAVEAYVCRALGLAPGPGHPGHRPGPARRVPLRLRLGRGDDRADRHRGPPPGPHRGRRGRGAVRRRPEGQLGDAAQAQPDPVGAPRRAWPGCCAATWAPASRTWPSGTSATSPTARSSGSSSPTPACSPTTCCARRPASSRGLVVYADRTLANLIEGSLGLVFCQPVLLALVASGLHPGRRLPDRPARRPAGAGRGATGRSATCSTDDPEVTLTGAALDDAFDLERCLRHARPGPRRPGRRSTTWGP